MCSEMVVFDGIDRSAKLPEGETVAIEFTPERAGEIPFQCQMGMLRGKVVVE
jgi:plastocyanin domain-containing protein